MPAGDTCQGWCSLLATVTKWKPDATVTEIKTTLRHPGDLLGHVQHGRIGLGLGETILTWQKHTLVEEMHHWEEAARCVRAEEEEDHMEQALEHGVQQA